ncbi:MAG: hypothetical protein AAB706_00520 [Patescibacteria group bacterium]
MDKEIKHYKCKNCKKVSAGIGVIPKCKCQSKQGIEMEEIKKGEKK